MRKLVITCLFLAFPAFLMIACSTSNREIEVTFIGDGCEESGPTRLTIGERSFYFRDTSGEHAEFWVRRFTDGKTYKDLIDLQPYPGAWIDHPSWVTSVRPVNDEWNEDVYIRTYNLDIDGNYAVVINTIYDEIWVCFPFTVR